MTPTAEALLADLDIDAAALDAKYRIERAKRIRPEGAAQYVDTSGMFARYSDDPWADPDFTRAPLNDEVDVVIIGGGLSAILAGANLRKAGVESVRFVERAGDFGGVWYWNRYPGAACDTQAILYLPMLEELGVMPSRRYATQREILAHFQRVAQHFDLYRDTCFQTEVRDVSWDEEAARWIMTTDRGDAMRARHVVITSGAMMRPKLPGIPGIVDFKGHSFHSSRWDYDYTGGTTMGGLTKLADKRVAIIGTGATAVQVIPHLAESAQHLYVFQRTPSSIDERDNSEFDSAWLASLQPGWQRELLENFTAQTAGILTDRDLVRDGWTSVMTNIRFLLERAEVLGLKVESPLELMQVADYMKMEQLRARIDDVVQDPATAATLKPWYNRFCKRPCFSSNYLPTFNRPNVTLVDTAGKGVERITEDTIVVDGKHYPVDCLVYSTGFEFGAAIAKHISYSVHGRGGISLVEKWADGAATQHGVVTNGFPNLFIMSTAQTGLSFNFAHMLEEQAKHIAYILDRALSGGARTIEVTTRAQDEWHEELDRAALPMVEFQRECTPSYLNFEGQLARVNARDFPYGGGPFNFYGILADWRAEGNMRGLHVTHYGQDGRSEEIPAPAHTDCTISESSNT